jgi:hypothetical protein
MPQYLIAGYMPDDFDPSSVTEAMGQAIHAFNEEMEDAGVLKLAGGLGATKSLRAQSDGKVLVTDAWARKGVAATRGQVEVREIFFMPSTD